MTEDLGPFNGSTPKWIQYVVYLLKQGVAFQVVAIVLLTLLIMAYFGQIENPQMNRLIHAVQTFNDEHQHQGIQHDAISRGVDRSNQYLDRNMNLIQSSVYYQQRTCVNTATTEEERDKCIAEH